MPSYQIWPGRAAANVHSRTKHTAVISRLGCRYQGYLRFATALITYGQEGNQLSRRRRCRFARRVRDCAYVLAYILTMSTAYSAPIPYYDIIYTPTAPCNMLSRGFDEPSLLRCTLSAITAMKRPYIDARNARGHYDAIVPIEMERKSLYRLG